jgi:hypothetical protein
MREEYKEHKYNPAGKCANTARKTPLVQEEADGERADDLGNPINEIIQTAGTDVEESTVVVIEFCDFGSIMLEKSTDKG